MNDDNFKELKEFVEFLFDVIDISRAAGKNGKLDLLDLQYVPSLFVSAQRGINNLGNPIERWKALQQGDRDALLDLGKTRFDLPNDALEALIERWLDAGVIVAVLVSDTLAHARRDEADAA